MGIQHKCKQNHETVFTIGITTYNREAELKNNLKNIAEIEGNFVEAVYIVNHGSRLSFDPKLIFERTILIEQSNVGGAGGFTRTMVACLEHLGCVRPPTHHIIMDDDAIAKPEMFVKAKQATILNPNKCFGGHMRNKEDNNKIAEIGVKVTKQGEWQGIGREINVNSQQARTLLEKPIEIDAHAWWFWVVPVSAIQKIGLPLPLFIKGDDIEYSYRSKMCGYETLYLPDIHVTHPSISKKGSNWRFYYLARNTAIVASCSAHIQLPRHYAFFRMVAALVRHEYYRVELEIIGIKDFLNGPDYLINQSGDVIHQNLLNNTSKIEKPEIISSDHDTIADNSKTSISRYAHALLINFFMKSDKVPKFIWTGNGPVDPLTCVGKSYLMPLAENGLAEKFIFQRGQFIRLFFKIVSISFRFAFAVPKVSQRWSQAKPKLTSYEYWKSQFAKINTD